MATQEEEVHIKFTTDTKGMDQAAQAQEQHTKKVNQANLSIGKLIGTITAGGVVLFKFNTLLKFGSVLFAKNADFSKKYTVNVLSMASSITKNVLPALGRGAGRSLGLLGVFAALAISIAATSLAIKAFVVSLKTTEAGFKRAQSVANTWNVVWATLIKTIGNAADAVTTAADRILSDWKRVFNSPITTLLYKFLTDLNKIGEKLFEQNQKYIESQKTRLKNNSILIKQLGEVNRELAKEGLSNKDLIKLYNRRAEIEANIATERVAELKLKQQLLRAENLLTETSTEKIQENLLEIERIENRINIAEEKGNDILRRRDQLVGEIKRKTKNQTDVEIEQATFASGIDIPSEEEATAALLAEIDKRGIYSFDKQRELAEQVMNMKLDSVESFKELEESFTDWLDTEEGKRWENRKKWESVKNETIIAGAFGLSTILRSIDENDLENQKRTRSIAAVIDTAAALAAVWIKPGYPGAIPLSVQIAANGIAQLNTIKNAKANTTLSPVAISGINSQQFGALETAAADFFRTNQSRANQQVVLYSDDLHRVNYNQSVTVNRSSLG